MSSDDGPFKLDILNLWVEQEGLEIEARFNQIEFEASQPEPGFLDLVKSAGDWFNYNLNPIYHLLNYGNGVATQVLYGKAYGWNGQEMSQGDFWVSAVGAVPVFSLAKGLVFTSATAAKTTTNFSVDAIILTTSSKSIAPSRVYTIYDGSGQLYKFGVTGENLLRYHTSRLMAGPGATGKISSVMMPKYQAHIMEKYLRSLHYNSTGVWRLDGMKIPYPVNFNTGLPIKP